MSTILQTSQVEDYLLLLMHKLQEHYPTVELDRTRNSADYMTKLSNLEIKTSITSKSTVHMWVTLEGNTQIYVSYVEEEGKQLTKCVLQVTESNTKLLDNRDAYRVGVVTSNIFNTLLFIKDKQSTQVILDQMAVLTDYKGEE